MTPIAQRLAIAQACGWKPLFHAKDNPDTDVWYNPVGGRKWKGHDLGIPHRSLPDYVNDLNAIHAAEKRVLGNGASKWAGWEHELGTVVMRVMKTNHAYLSDMCHADAAIRSEALLKTLKSWTP